MLCFVFVWYYRISIYRGEIYHDIAHSTTTLILKPRLLLQTHERHPYLASYGVFRELFGEKWPRGMGSIHRGAHFTGQFYSWLSLLPLWHQCNLVMRLPQSLWSLKDISKWIRARFLSTAEQGLSQWRYVCSVFTDRLRPCSHLEKIGPDKSVEILELMHHKSMCIFMEYNTAKNML